MRRAVGWWRARSVRVRLAIGAIVAVCIGWPGTAIPMALGAPLFEQVMLGLSWLAPAFTAVDMLFTAQVHEQTEEADDGRAGAVAGIDAQGAVAGGLGGAEGGGAAPQS